MKQLCGYNHSELSFSIVQMLNPAAVSTFEEYFNSVVALFSLRQLEDIKTLEIVPQPQYSH